MDWFLFGFVGFPPLLLVVMRRLLSFGVGFMSSIDIFEIWPYQIGLSLGWGHRWVVGI